MLFVHGNVVLLLLTSLCLLFLQFQYLPILSYKVGEEREGKNRVGGGGGIAQQYVQQLQFFN